MGEAGEGRNITHQQKKLNEAELLEFRTRFEIPISDEQAKHAEFYKPPEDSRKWSTSASTARRWAGSCPAAASRRSA